jgi:purine-binding chemotaxis protein CheW
MTQRGIKFRPQPADRERVNTGVSSAVRAGRTSPGPSLLCRTGDRLLAVPVANVVETMRPLPVESFPGINRFVLGVSKIRGAVVPVIDVGGLTGDGGISAGVPGRFVTLAFDGRTVALAVDAVIGVRTLDDAILDDLPPLLDSVDRENLSAIGILDAHLLVVLDSSHLVPESVWTSLTESANEEVITS